MPNNLPVLLGNSGMSHATPMISAHAQNFATTKLNQQKERDAASVSMGRVIQKKQYGESGGPSTSIDHIIQGLPDHGDAYAGYTDEERDEIRTRLRYQHIRKLNEEKKVAADAAALKKSQEEQGGLHIKTGGTYSSSGWGGAQKTLKKEFKTKKYTDYKNLSSSDKKHLQDIVKEHSIYGSIGGGHSYSTKKSMGQASWKKYKEGQITKEDYKDFKRIIRDMD
ncbi:MAG: hypothetical protein UV82_C0012G0012 [Candidatus Magasanikbacteria bacterium GW2011_GWD2_43_18]|uniref:Uncharacterized protein n=1 Tax=Candidatus Magasanikbacteria bacterium GW2011_GWE2_42_7 TaxID=1619052 RepID=A0A0G1BHJ2_9BACT|nr:MAG: hypothetical protein UV18_C0005G0098 [Candidatus Magasanikbacteria bacterium GW2011_GWC2_42_27]KKS72807.1 MAG: hypothetical protein UV42_C0004G0019 [Candidatus Magasanikbacteria bacterium GW2011_GWE2_42_7]KKT04027.1 MAG: hypothetical protein UV82_C0012G0012 [Candidatus Magasanikbacteria bacterium GW2011_GWD2_43_18]KKT24925.1 MAG: hypothetical protein UW10_C0017G0004 [Candidatus Magasanikbacteria bacterium GW2011_GWA2_43_9]HBB37940.1 hypothetical protein [Candidatus Magasanikbacteria bac